MRVTTQKTLGNHEGSLGTEKTTQYWRNGWAPLLTFSLNLDSRWELHPGSLADLQGAIACSQLPLLELDPAEIGEYQSVHTRGPSNPAGADA